MIKKHSVPKDRSVKVTFSLDENDARLPASVLGDFNGWDAAAHPLKKRNNGTWSVVVTLGQGKVFRFRYRTKAGAWFNDDEADGYEPTGVGSQNCLVKT